MSAQDTVPFISIHAPRGGSDSKDVQIFLFIFGERYKKEKKWR